MEFQSWRVNAIRDGVLSGMPSSAMPNKVRRTEMLPWGCFNVGVGRGTPISNTQNLGSARSELGAWRGPENSLEARRSAAELEDAARRSPPPD